MVKSLIGEVLFYVAIFGFSDLIVSYFQLKNILCIAYYSFLLLLSLFLLKNELFYK